MSSDLEDGLEVDIDGDDGTTTTTIAAPSPYTPTHSYNTRSRARSNSNVSHDQSATSTTPKATTNTTTTTNTTPKARRTATATSSSNQKKASATSSESNSFLFGEDDNNVDVEEFSSTGTSTGSTAPMTSSAETPFDRYLRIYVCEPVLQMVPHSVNPNTISYVNVGVCWLTLALAFEAYRTEHEYQLWSFTCRILMAITVFISLVLDCLDGMQARRTNRCSKLGETLDHGFDAANAPIMCASLLVAIGPDDYSLAIGLVATSMIYNAQLIIYRHHRIMINGPVNGPEAQMLVSVSHLAFAVFFYLCDRDSYTVQTIVQVFCLISNITQFSNCWFFVKHLTRSFDQSILAPHVRFSVQAGAFALFYLIDSSGTLSRSSFVIGSIIIAFRLNGLYVLLTIAKYRTLNAQQFKQAMLTEDLPWYPEVVFGIAVIAIGSYLLPAALFTYVPWLFYLSLVALNVRDMQLWYDKLT